jgi:UDP-3-O-[3-hydroxymyristoyl] N-acetylglucosamine deacetylase
MKLQKLSQRRQRTVSRPVEVRGMGFLTGADVRLCFKPAPADTGIVFVRTDLSPAVRIPARLAHVVGTQRRTTLGIGTTQVALVEHVLAALAGFRIDNCLVELNAPEPPGLDGSAGAFSAALHQTGAEVQQAWRTIWGVEELVMVSAGTASMALEPGPVDEFRISYFLDYGMESPIGRQSCSSLINPETFANELANCRTFLLEYEALELRRQGYGPRVTTADLLVIGSNGPINNQLRYHNEMARHKALDIVGDLSLLGGDLCGHLVACRSGHPLNMTLLQALTASADYPARCAA